MKIMKLLSACVIALALTSPATGQDAATEPDEPTPGVMTWEGSVTAQEWDAYSERFVTETGRVVDNVNDNISHSEGQGYGLLLSYMADDKADFARIWSFTQRELLIRNDGLMAWKWSDGDRPRVTDINNASDGDILVAYALIMAGEAWGVPEYFDAGTSIRDAIKNDMVKEQAGRAILLPGAEGFITDDGIIINPSYWVQEALGLFAQTDSDGPWSDLAKTGRSLPSAWIATNQNSSPLPEWALLKDGDAQLYEVPGDVNKSSFSYNALRAPLYAVRAGMKKNRSMSKIASEIVDKNGNLLLKSADGSVSETLNDVGYKALASLLQCAMLNRPQGAIAAFVPTDYYPSTIHLLSLSAARVRAPECVIEK